MPVKILLLALIFASSPAAFSSSNGGNLPKLGDSVSGVISLEQERKLGQEFLRSLRAQAPTVSDPLLKNYLEHLVYRLAAHSQLEDKRLDTVIIDDPRINAFAVPGGVIGINKGLFMNAETEHEVAAILAHELAHLSQRHFARRIQADRKSSITSMAGLLAGILLMATAGGEAGMAAMTTAQAAAQNQALSYNRSREAEADRIGIDTLADADMDPRAMAYMFERLDRANRYAGDQVPEFLRTHPVTRSRIADSYNQSRNYERKQYPTDLDYQLMRNRVLVMSAESPSSAVNRMKVGLDQPDLVKQAASRYGLVLALTEKQETDEALRHLRMLEDEYPGKIAFILAKADIHVEAKRYEQALEILKDAVETNPDNYPLTMAYARTLLKADQPKEAEPLLVNLTRKRENDQDIWYLLAETYGLANNIVGVHQARAEYFVLNGNFDQAIKQLGYALPLVEGNFQSSARIRQRIEEIHELREEREQRG
ncbi:MAG: M48 family metalloprotease [Pseudomonadales bacterium]